MKPITAWAGVTDGELDIESWPFPCAVDGYCRIYKTRRDALKYYEFVVKVTIAAKARGAK